MRLDAATIGQVARRAGFHGPDLHTAIAVALAASGGITAYRHTYGLPGTGDCRGLWGIDVDRHPQVAVYDLHTAYQAAQAARVLTDEAGGFGWSAVYRAGAHRTHLAYAAGEASRDMHTQRLAQAYDVHTATEAVLRSIEQNTRCRGRLARAPNLGR